MDGHLSPINLADSAREFVGAARREREHAGRGTSITAYFLVARALELVLKAYLVFRGRSEAQLRAISHDLNKALADSTREGLASLVNPAPEEIAALSIINDYYSSKDLEYLHTGYKSYPDHELLAALVDKILSALARPLRSWRPPS